MRAPLAAFGPVLLAFGLVACGGSTADEAADGGADAVADAPAIDVDVDGSGVEGCDLTNERATIEFVDRDGTRDGCASASGPDASASPREIDGQITAVTLDGFSLDTCPPNADCAPSTVRFVADAPGIELARALPVGAYVRVRWSITRFFACQASLEVDSLATWGTVPNPVAGLPGLLLAVADGAKQLDGAPFVVDRELLECGVDAGAGCGSVTPGAYRFTFTPANAEGPVLHVPMGAVVPWPALAPGAGTWDVKNLRSYQSTACDDYWNFAWFVAFREPG